MPNSPSWSRPAAPQHVDVRELARRQNRRRPGVEPSDPRADGRPPGGTGPADQDDVFDGQDDVVDDQDDLDDEFDEDPREEAGEGARHRAGIAPWRQEVLRRAADRLPPGVRALRWRVGRSAARGVVVVAVLVVVGLATAAFLSWPRQDAAVAGQAVPPRTDPVAVSTAAVPAPAAVPGGTGESGTATPSAAPTPAADVVVHVAGQVAHPGLVTLPAGSRVAEAIAAAGGAGETADLDRVNLARPLVDGEQVLVPAPGEAVVVAPGSSSGAAGAPAGGAPAGVAAGGSAAAGPLDLNAATEGDLDALPGVGEVLAGRILAWRTEHSRFSDVEELGEVRGIGPKLLDGLRPLVRV